MASIRVFRGINVFHRGVFWTPCKSGFGRRLNNIRGLESFSRREGLRQHPDPLGLDHHGDAAVAALLVGAQPVGIEPGPRVPSVIFPGSGQYEGLSIHNRSRNEGQQRPKSRKVQSDVKPEINVIFTKLIPDLYSLWFLPALLLLFNSGLFGRTCFGQLIHFEFELTLLSLCVVSRFIHICYCFCIIRLA